MMNCQFATELTAWPCRPIEGINGEGGMVLAPPVAFWDGSVVPVYIFDRQEQFEITDDGGLLDHLHTSGFRLNDKRRRKGLEAIAQAWGLALADDLSIWCRKDGATKALHQYLGALFGIARWEAENAGKAQDTEHLIAEAEMYLRAVAPTEPLSKDVPLIGISGRPQVFPLRLGSTYYDAVGAHPASSASVVKKLVDVRYVRENRDTAITVILEDRINADRAKGDLQIFTQLAHVERFSDLQQRAMSVMAVQ